MHNESIFPTLSQQSTHLFWRAHAHAYRIAGRPVTDKELLTMNQGRCGLKTKKGTPCKINFNLEKYRMCGRQRIGCQYHGIFRCHEFGGYNDMGEPCLGFSKQKFKGQYCSKHFLSSTSALLLMT